MKLTENNYIKDVDRLPRIACLIPVVLYQMVYNLFGLVLVLDQVEDISPAPLGHASFYDLDGAMHAGSQKTESVFIFHNLQNSGTVLMRCTVVRAIIGVVPSKRIRLDCEFRVLQAGIPD